MDQLIGGKKEMHCVYEGRERKREREREREREEREISGVRMRCPDRVNTCPN